MRIAGKGMPISVTKVEDIGRQKIVRAVLEGQPIAAIMAEGDELPAHAHAVFDPKGINLYADDWRVETEDRP